VNVEEIQRQAWSCYGVSDISSNSSTNFSSPSEYIKEYGEHRGKGSAKGEHLRCRNVPGACAVNFSTPIKEELATHEVIT